MILSTLTAAATPDSVSAVVAEMTVSIGLVFAAFGCFAAALILLAWRLVRPPGNGPYAELEATLKDKP